MTRNELILINEFDHPPKKTISIRFDKNTVILTSNGGNVEIKRSENYGQNAKITSKNADFYDVAAEILVEMATDGTLECSRLEINKLKMEPPSGIGKIRCDSIQMTFLGKTLSKSWLKMVEGPLEKLNITELDGTRELEILKSVTNELILGTSDVTDDEVKTFAAKTLILNSEKITEHGVRFMLEKWLEQFEKGNILSVRFEPNEGFKRKSMLRDLPNCEIEWKREFEFHLKLTKTSSGEQHGLYGNYFVVKKVHLLKILTLTDFPLD